jgi:formylglycine-generating enzyme required for sulfatase activity
VVDNPLRITRETEFYQGYIRFKLSVSNESPHLLGDISLDFIFDENLLHIAGHDNYTLKNGKFILGNISGGKSRSITILFEPLTCAKAADIRCQVNFTDHRGSMSSFFMKPKEISVICPIMKTESDINIGRLKGFIENLQSRDSRLYKLQNNIDLKELATLAREVIERHDVRHLRTLYTLDGKTLEIWYYGRTKVNRDDIIISFSALAEDRTIELFAATQNAGVLTGLLAELGRDLKQTIESGANENGRVINFTIRDSVVQRSNLLDMCEIDGTCDVNVVIEDSVVQRSNIASHNGNRRLNSHEEKAKILETPDNFHPPDNATKKADRKKVLIPLFVFLVIGGIWMGLSGSTEALDLFSSQDNASYDNDLNASDSENMLNVENIENPEGPDISMAASKMKTNPETYTNSIGMEFVLIPGGEFEMGSSSYETDRNDEGPVHEVKIWKVYLGKYEVTQEQWVSVMGSNPSRFSSSNNPVESVSWNDVLVFIRKLNEMEGTDRYRLPSEAEWEYACRAGTSTSYSFGNDVSELKEYAWFEDANGTHEAGTKKPNSWGLYDMHGNVDEWVQDVYHDSYANAPVNGSSWEDVDSTYRVNRGGSWSLGGERCRCASRDSCDAGSVFDGLGFRLLAEV